MDNNNNSSVYGTDPFDSPLLQNFLQVDPALVYVSNDAMPQQQNDPFGLLQASNVPFPNLVIQDQPMRDNNNFPIGGGGGGVGNFEASPSTMKGKELMFQGQFMHANNIFNGGLGNFEPPPPREENQSQPPYQNMGSHNYEDVIALLDWPPSPKPFFCSCCQVLRQIIHTNGSKFEKLEIHGTIGMINHAIIQIQNVTPDGPATDAHQMVDFCNKSAAEIKRFLEEYCDHQNQLGYIIMEDALSAYYEAICTGMDWTDEFSEDEDDLIPQNAMEQDPEPEPEPEPENGSTSTSKPNLSDQRKRVPKMTLNDLSGVFHIPIKAAAKQLGVCPTVVKKICRKADLKRWPQRKVNSIVKRVAVLRGAFDSPDPGIRARTRAEIERLQQVIIESCGGIAPTGIEMLQFQG